MYKKICSQIGEPQNCLHLMIRIQQVLRSIVQRIKRHQRYMLNLSATFVSQAASAVSLLILTPILLNQLGTEQFGTYGVLLNIVVFASFSDFGLNTSLLRRIIHEPEKAARLINTQFFFFLGVFFISIPFYYLFIQKNGNGIEGNFFPLCAAVLVVQNMIAVLFDVLIQSVNKIFLGKLIRISKIVAEFIVLLITCRWGNILWLLLSSIFINILYILLLMFFSRREVNFKISFRLFSFQVLKEHLQYSIWYFLAIVATVLVFNAQLLLLTSLVSSVLVAQYLLVTRFFEVIKMGLANFAIVLFPRLIHIHSEGNWVKLKALHFNTFVRICFLCIIAYVVLYFVGEAVFIRWSGQSSGEILSLFRWFTIFILLIVVDSVSALFLSALKWNKTQTLVAISQGVLSLWLSYMLIPDKGIAGLAIASVVSLLLTNFIFNIVYLRVKIDREIRQLEI